MKTIQDMEGEIGSKEVELAALKEEARKLEEYDPATEHEKEMDGDVCVLKSISSISVFKDAMIAGCGWTSTKHWVSSLYKIKTDI